MIRYKKGRFGWYQATPKTSKHSLNCNELPARVKSFVITLALWGGLPLCLADWLIRQGEAHDE